MDKLPLKVRDLVTEDLKQLVMMGDNTIGTEHLVNFVVYDRKNNVTYSDRRSVNFSDAVLDIKVISWYVEPDLQNFDAIIVRIEAER